MEMPARGDAAFRATIRFASAPTTCCCAAVGGSAALRMRHTPCGCRSAHLVEVQTNLLLPTMHTVSIMRTAASEAMPLRQAIPGLIESEVERSYVRVMNRRQSNSEDRSKSNRLDIKQGRHLIRQALQFFELLACNGGVKGWSPFIRPPCAAQGNIYPASAAFTASTENSVHARSSLAACSSRNALYAASSMLSPFSV